MTEYRAHQWLNINTKKTVYSIQARVGKRGWAHAHEGGIPMFYDTAEERDAKLEEMNGNSVGKRSKNVDPIFLCDDNEKAKK